MTEISLNLPEDLSNSLAELAKTNGQTATYLAIDVLHDYIEHEKTLTAQIKLRDKGTNLFKAQDKTSDVKQIFSFYSPKTQGALLAKFISADIGVRPRYPTLSWQEYRGQTTIFNVRQGLRRYRVRPRYPALS